MVDDIIPESRATSVGISSAGLHDDDRRSFLERGAALGEVGLEAFR